MRFDTTAINIKAKDDFILQIPTSSRGSSDFAKIQSVTGNDVVFNLNSVTIGSNTYSHPTIAINTQYVYIFKRENGKLFLKIINTANSSDITKHSVVMDFTEIKASDFELPLNTYVYYFGPYSNGVRYFGDCNIDATFGTNQGVSFDLRYFILKHKNNFYSLFSKEVVSDHVLF